MQYIVCHMKIKLNLTLELLQMNGSYVELTTTCISEN